MTKKDNGETKRPAKSPQLLGPFRNFFVNAFIKIKLLFGRSESTSSKANSGNAVNIGPPVTEEPEKMVYDSPHLLILPPNIRNKFFRLASSRQEFSPSLMNHAGNHSTLALLNLNNVYFWGFNNVQPALTARNLNDLKAILKYEKTFSVHAPILLQPEADAILKAFSQKMSADHATMFIDRKQCNTCGRRDFNPAFLRTLLPVLRLKELTVYTSNSLGKITKLVLSPALINSSQQNFW